MSRIFISYRRDDSAGYVGRLYDRLRDHFGAESIFMDIDTIDPGDDFVESIDNAVGDSDVVLVVIGKQWLTITDAQGRPRLRNPHDFVRLEVATALRRDVRVIPLLVRGALVPYEDQLPDELQSLIRRNALELGDRNFHHDVDKLIEVIEKSIKPPPAPKPAVRSSQPAQKPVSTSSAAPVSRPRAATTPTSSFKSPSIHLDGGTKRALIWRPAIIFGLAWVVASLLIETSEGFLQTVGFVLIFSIWPLHGISIASTLRHLETPRRGKSLGWYLSSGFLGMMFSGGIMGRVVTYHMRHHVYTVLAWIAGLLIGYVAVLPINSAVCGDFTCSAFENAIVIGAWGLLIGLAGGYLSVRVLSSAFKAEQAAR